MSHSAINTDHLFELAGAICDETASHSERFELNSIMLADLTSRRNYLGYCQIHAALRLQLRANRATQKVHQQINDELVAPTPSELNVVNAETSDSPAPTLPATLFHSTLGYFSEGMPLAYLLATVITGLGLLIGSMIHVSVPEQVARNSSVPAVVVKPKMEFVGRITGMVECRWADPSSAVIGPAVVPLGRQYSLKSGLMEITYDTGAKVILQGPATYKVDSQAGGYLSVGKLTARLNTKGEGGRRKAELPNPQSLIPNPLFSVRTPTATVTDLGTEFGVEVGNDGTCEVHVLKGLVQAKFFGSGGQMAQTLQLTAGEGRRYQRDLARLTAIPANRAEFEQMQIVHRDGRPERWLAYSRQLRKDPALVAYYLFEAVGKDSWLLPNVAATGPVLDANIEGPLWTSGRLPGKMALHFRGQGSGDKVVLPDQKRFNFTGAFSVAVWYKNDAAMPGFQALATKGNTAWRIQQFGDGNDPQFDTGKSYRSTLHELRGRANTSDGCWHLVVAVYEPGKKTDLKWLYLDGRLEAASRDVPRPLPVNDQPVWLGSNSAVPEVEFHGRIDEVAIFSRVLSGEEIAAMFQAGDPAGTAVKKGGAMEH